MAYNINYNDKRFTQVESDKKAALSEAEKTYNGMINNSDKFYQAQIDASKDWADTQSKLQQEQTDFAIEKIEQQKEQAQKDYIKEQQGAYADWQKQSNRFGAHAEMMAAQGHSFSGYSESSQVAMYTAYQNRVAMAKESINKAILNYDNGMTEARLQNNSALAEIKYQALQQQLELSLQGYQYKNTLILAKADKKSEIEDRYYSRYQNVLQQINTENALAEQVRQYNENLAEEKRQFNAQLAEQQRQFNVQNQAAEIEKDKTNNTQKVVEKLSGKKSTSSQIKEAQQYIKNKETAKNKKTNLITKAQNSTFKTEKEALNFLKKNGITGTGGLPLLTSFAWNKAKKSGQQGSEFEYSSYKDYLKNYVVWRVQNS